MKPQNANWPLELSEDWYSKCNDKENSSCGENNNSWQKTMNDWLFLGNLKSQQLLSLRHPKTIFNRVLFSLFFSSYTAKTFIIFRFGNYICIWWFSISCFQVLSAVRIDLKYSKTLSKLPVWMLENYKL